MKRLLLRPAPCPRHPQHLLAGWRVARVLCLGGALLMGAGGCSGLPGLQSAIPSSPPTTAESRRRAQSAKGFNSLANALSKLDAKTIKRYVDRYSKPAGARPTATGRKIYIDVDALARQHPAWKLANDLESGVVTPASPQRANLAFPPRLLPVSAPAVAQSRGELFRLAPQRRIGVSSNFMDGATRGRQGLDSFLDNWSERQAGARRDDSYLARRALEDEIAASMRNTVDLIPLQGVSSQTALELSNLRLRLLANLPTSLDERDRVRTRIAQIEAQLQSVWRAQTEEQEARLREAFVEIPARKRREGEERFQATEREREAQDRLARQQLSRDLEATLTDTDTPTARALRLALPSTRVPLASDADSQRPFPPTPSRSALSIPPLDLPPALAPATSPVTAQRIAALRALARKEARLWAQKSAASEGATWTSSPGAHNHTSRSLHLLQGQNRSSVH